MFYEMKLCPERAQDESRPRWALSGQRSVSKEIVHFYRYVSFVIQTWDVILVLLIRNLSGHCSTLLDIAHFYE